VTLNVSMYDAQRMHIEESPRYVSCYT
jgi:hypothetical protein